MPKCKKLQKTIKKLHIFRTPFPRNTFGQLLLILYTQNLYHKAFINLLVKRKNTYVGYSTYAKNTCWSVFSWDKFAKIKIGQSILRLTQKTLCLQKISQCLIKCSLTSNTNFLQIQKKHISRLISPIFASKPASTTVTIRLTKKRLAARDTNSSYIKVCKVQTLYYEHHVLLEQTFLFYYYLCRILAEEIVSNMFIKKVDKINCKYYQNRITARINAK